jgi:putative DNA primase/helicase
LNGKSVLIWPDKDKAGWAYAQAASQAVLRAGATSCVILLPDDAQPEAWDAFDAVQAQFDVHNFIEHGPRIKVHAADDELPPPASEFSVLGSCDALALSFAQQYREDWRFVSAWGRWMLWDGLRWRADETLAAGDLVRHICRHAALQADNRREALQLASSGMVSGVERLTKLDQNNAGKAHEWDVDRWLINTPGGVVDLRTGQQRPHKRADYMTKLTTASLSHQDCPNWLRFLEQATGNDQALIDYLQRVFGYCLSGSTQEHALFFLYGTGANGKSVFVNTLTTLLGDYATSAPMDTFMESRSDRHPTDLAGLRGARFVTATETEQGRRWNESKIKEITGGDRVSARFMRQDFFTFTPQFKLLIAGNHKPAIRNIDEAMRRRLHLIPFTLTVPPHQRDKHLSDKLLTERDAIFGWGVQGCLKWQQLGIEPPPCVRQATDEYFESEDAIGRWLLERCVFDANAKALTVELFTDWKQWAEANGEFIGSQKRFADALITRRIEKWRNSCGARGFVGIGLKEPTQHPQVSYPYIND